MAEDVRQLFNGCKQEIEAVKRRVDDLEGLVKRLAERLEACEQDYAPQTGRVIDRAAGASPSARRRRSS